VARREAVKQLVRPWCGVRFLKSRPASRRGINIHNMTAPPLQHPGQDHPRKNIGASRLMAIIAGSSLRLIVISGSELHSGIIYQNIHFAQVLRTRPARKALFKAIASPKAVQGLASATFNLLAKSLKARAGKRYESKLTPRSANARAINTPRPPRRPSADRLPSLNLMRFRTVRNGPRGHQIISARIIRSAFAIVMRTESSNYSLNELICG